ncbi:response regulator [Geobacter sp.]|uniref:response regulator n=1 Tax=Geobacter sp. TaxID=46610 RepID=UPI00261634CF|nr:response regulator [Geobacter sp.]
MMNLTRNEGGGPDSGNGQRIIVVDDDPDVLFFVKAVFDRGGFEVSCAENGEQALQLLAQGDYQLMLTDLNMPGMDGIELARRARTLRPELTVILATGQSSTQVRQWAATAGISAVFGKPFTYDKLLKCLRFLRPPSGAGR